MLILLPPSEGKTAPRRGHPIRLDDLGFPTLTSPRDAVLEHLVGLCAADEGRAARVLGLGPTQLDEVRRNAGLRTAPTARADLVYSGVLYEALDLGSLRADARRRAGRWLAVTSSLFGLVRPQDHIPAYRLSGEVSLPGLGKISAHWRWHLDPAVRKAAGRGLVVDLRSSTYAAFWRPGPDLAAKTVTVRVLHEQGGRRTVVSHFNKATKGRLVRSVLEDGSLEGGSVPGTPRAFADRLQALGWQVETTGQTPKGTQLDVVIKEL